MSIRETTVMKTPETKVWTEAEFMALPDDGNRYELGHLPQVLRPRCAYLNGCLFYLF